VQPEPAASPMSAEEREAAALGDGVEDLGASLDFRDQRAWERHLAGADEVVGDVS